MKENPFFTKLKRLNSRVKFANKIAKAYYLGGTVYSRENYERISEAVRESSLNNFLEHNPYDSRKDNIELFWVEDDVGHAKVLVVLDPLELYESEIILHVIPSTEDFVRQVDKAEQIHPGQVGD